MERFKMLLIPAFVANLYKENEISLEQLLDSDNWVNIFSGATVNKVKLLNSFTGGGHENNDIVTNILGIKWMFHYTSMCTENPPKMQLLETLMPDGRESEVSLITSQLHNFELTFDFKRAPCGTYVILFNEMQNLNDICNRYVQLRSNMGALIDDMSSFVNYDDIVSEPIIQSYMTY